MNNLTDIQERTILAVKKAAAFIQHEIGRIHQIDIETKALNSLVTYVDKESEKILVAELKRILPEATFLTEENTIEQKQGEWQWIIDPLDGTTNFIHQVPVFGISVGLKHQDEVVVGVVYELNRNELFYAAKGQGAFLNGTQIVVSNTNRLADSLIATGFPYYDFELLENYLNVFQELMTTTRGIRRLGSAAIDLCFTACGRFDAFFEYSLSPWDVAAGALILQEAGGKIADFNGKDNWLYGRQIIGSNPHISAQILELVRKHF
ncbi:MAG: inositol monophosphatase [Sphingobacteriales bacterium]|jgi:myo-inositol-1(or 4)-monophosphatase|nr:inositol monophosphatase [Sphingobacteriales bacterium]